MFAYTFAFLEGSITIRSTGSIADAEECARGKALQLGWKNQILAHMTERMC